MITLEDKVAIQELIARSAQYSDYGEWERFASLFTPDVVTEMEGIEIRYEGVQAQVEHSQESDRRTEGKNRHVNINLFVSEQDGEVFAEYAFMNVNAGHTPLSAQIVVTGRQRDTVVKTGDGWKIARRFVRFDQKFGLDF